MQGHFECVKCGKKYRESENVLTCIHGKYYDYLEYRPARRAVMNPPIMGEGSTPLIRLKNMGVKYGLQNLYAKDEGKNPTGSFKDRESALLVGKALQMGLREVFCISSGNAGASLSAYANVAGLECTCYIPKGASRSKKAIIRLFGGRITEMDGSYEEIYRKVIDSVPGGWNCTLNPYRSEADKQIAYEIFQKIGIPDKIIVPCGNGTNIAGIWKGFTEIADSGKWQKLPMMIGVQVNGAAPLKAALDNGKEFEILAKIPESVAEGIIASESYSSPKAVRAIKDSGGSVIEVSENEIKQALKECLKYESLLMEPTSAAAFAAVPKVGILAKDKIVVIITASGAKSLEAVSEITGFLRNTDKIKNPA